jgi:hypothetical protein
VKIEILSDQRVFPVVSAYPDAKAEEPFGQLLEALANPPAQTGAP